MTRLWQLPTLGLLALAILGTTSASATPQLFITPNVTTIDFGTTTVGTPIDRTVFLQNIGSSDMYILQISVPAGFTAVNPPSTQLPFPPGIGVSMTLRMDATAVGNYSGTIRYDINAGFFSTQTLTGVVEEEDTDPPAQVIMLQPNADAHIVQETPDKNVGKQPILRIRSPNSGKGRYTFLRFNVPPLSGTIQSAVLRIRPQTKTITAAQIYDVNIGWAEQTITWNNWLNGGTTFSYMRETGTLAGEQWHEIDVREAIHLSGGTVNIGIATNSTTAGFRFYSRESAFVPTLEITVQ